MHTPEESTRLRDFVFLAQQVADAAIDSQGQPLRAGVIAICDVDIPVVIANGEVYVQAPLLSFSDAMQAAMVEFLRSLETGISEARSAALASPDFLPVVYQPRVAGADVVRGSGE